jgi:iron(III) transport system substrate-binding protein
VRALLILTILALAACARDKPQVVVYTSVDQVFSQPIFDEFERSSGIEVRALYDTEETKSTGVLNRLIAESPHPQADVFWSGDPVRPFLLIRRGLADTYVSPNARDIPESFKAKDGSWTGFAARARVLLVNKEKLGSRTMPNSILDLANTEWSGQAAIASPLYGTTTMHAGALFATWGDERARAFFDSLKANRVVLASSNGEVKRLVVSGQVVFGLTDTDDAHEAVKSGAPVEVVYPDQDNFGALFMPTSVMVMKGGPNPKTARQLVDYLLSKPVEQRMAASAAHIPLHGDAAHTAASGMRTMQVDYSQVADAIERATPWLRTWAGL